MNKTQLVDALAARLGDRHTAASAVDGLLETIVDTVKGGEAVTLTGFGVFEARARAARTARNPRTGEAVAVPAATVPAFRPGTGFRTAVGGGGAPAPRATPARAAKAGTATKAGTAKAGTRTKAGTAAKAETVAKPAAAAKATTAKAGAATKAKPAKADAAVNGKPVKKAVAKAEAPKAKKAKKK